MPTAGTRETILAEINWSDVFRKLAARTRFTTQAWRLPSIFDGVSGEDIVTQVFEDFINAPNMLGWEPERRNLEAFLWAVCRNKIINHVRRTRFVTPEAGEVLEELSILHRKADSTEGAIIDRDLITKIRNLVRNDPELTQLIQAMERTVESDCGNVNDQLASLLQMAKPRIVNLKKQLRRKVINFVERVKR